MEPSFIQNLRRSPRVAARCDAHVATPGGLFAAHTEDVSAEGCRLVVPQRIAEGEPLRVSLRHAGLTRHLRVPARVTWAARTAPWKLGLVFDPATQAPSARWFSQLVRSLGLPRNLGMPELIPVSATVYLGAPPLAPVELGGEELALLWAIREGTTVADLLTRFHACRPAVERALFSLLAQRYVTLSRADAVHPTVWRAFLSLQRGRLPADLVRGFDAGARSAIALVSLAPR
jgi:hypothetical protein